MKSRKIIKLQISAKEIAREAKESIRVLCAITISASRYKFHQDSTRKRDNSFFFSQPPLPINLRATQSGRANCLLPFFHPLGFLLKEYNARASERSANARETEH